MGLGREYPIPNGYGNVIINFNLSDIGYGYGDMLGSQVRGLGRQYSSSPCPIVMSNTIGTNRLSYLGREAIRIFYQCVGARFNLGLLKNFS